MVLLFVGAPLALFADALGQRWLFFVGIGLLVIAVALPARPGQSLGERLRQLVRHLPGARFVSRPSDDDST